MIALLSLTVADAHEVWERLGFSVEDGRARVGLIDLVLAGSGDGGRGVTGWTLATGATSPSTLDGLATTWSRRVDAAPAAPVHPNGVQRIDHLVVMTPDVERTVAAFERLGMEVRRRREGEAYGRPMRQAFFWLGDPGDQGSFSRSSARPRSTRPRPPTRPPSSASRSPWPTSTRPAGSSASS